MYAEELLKADGPPHLPGMLRLTSWSTLTRCRRLFSSFTQSGAVLIADFGTYSALMAGLLSPPRTAAVCNTSTTNISLLAECPLPRVTAWPPALSQRL